MNQLDQLNIEWTGICNLMQLLNEQRIQVYYKWRDEMANQGWEFTEEVPLELETIPSFYHDLNGQSIDITGLK
jgi:hypothetical protein